VNRSADAGISWVKKKAKKDGGVGEEDPNSKANFSPTKEPGQAFAE